MATKAAKQHQNETQEFRVDKQPKKGVIRFLQFVPQRHVASVVVDRSGALIVLNEHLVRDNSFRLEPIDIDRMISILQAAKEAYSVIRKG